MPRHTHDACRVIASPAARNGAHANRSLRRGCASHWGVRASRGPLHCQGEHPLHGPSGVASPAPELMGVSPGPVVAPALPVPSGGVVVGATFGALESDVGWREVLGSAS